MKYLIVEDEKEISHPLMTELYRSEDVTEVITTDSGEEAVEIFRQDPEIGFIALDLTLKGGDKYGMDVLKEIREFSDVPIVILSTDMDPNRQIEAEELGADGYLVKEIFKSPLAIRQYFESILNKVQSETLDGSGCYSFQGWVFDTQFNRRLVNPDGAEVKLTANEFELLQVFVEQPGKVISQAELIERLRPDQSGG